MSDQATPPPKPKPGSLRDRIAAFEKPAASGPAPGPAPRPKPGGISWKPKVPSPPSSPSANPSVGGSPERKPGAGGMSASDAKESIGKGGSLKERMAALQNRGGFGVPPPVAPKPALEKPKWKPPPVVAPVDKDEDDLPRGEPTVKSPPVLVAQIDDEEGAAGAVEGETSTAGADEGEKVENDEEEEERQRRAAIAARMARLGGARVGMAPVFGKPSVRRPEPKEEPVPAASEGVTEPSKVEDDVLEQPPADATADATAEEILPDVETLPDRPPTERKNSEAPSVGSIDSESQAQASRSPSSMPLPSAPRRAGPPRKKAIKSPTPATPVLGEEIVESPPTVQEMTGEILGTAADEEHPQGVVGDQQEEIGEVDRAVEEPEMPHKTVHEFPVVDEEEEEPAAVSSPAAETNDLEGEPTNNDNDIAEVDEPETKHSDVAPSRHSTDPPVNVESEELSAHHAPTETEPSPQVPGVSEIQRKTSISEPLPAPAEEEDEESEEAVAARRKRLAEKFAKMGGVNPLAPPPQRKSSQSEEPLSPTSPTSPALPRRTSVGSPPPVRRDSIPVRRASTDSHASSEGIVPHVPASPLPPVRKVSVGSSVERGLGGPGPVRRGSQDQDDSRAEPSAGSPGISSTPKPIPEEYEEPIHMEGLPEESETYQEGREHGVMITEDEPTITRSPTGGRRDSKRVSGLALAVSDRIKENNDLDAPPTPMLPVPPPPPVPHRSTRPDMRHEQEHEIPVDPALGVDPVPVPPRSLPPPPPPAPARVASPPVRNIPAPPPQLVPETPQPDDASDSDPENEQGPGLARVLALSQSIQVLTSPVSQQVSDNEDEDTYSPRPIPPRVITSEENTDNDTEPPLPVPHRRSLELDLGPNKNRNSGMGGAGARRPPSYAAARPVRGVPAYPPLVGSTPTSDVESDYDEVLPTRPRHRPVTPGTPPPPSPNEVPLIVPPPHAHPQVAVVAEEVRRPDPSPLRQSAFPPPPPPPHPVTKGKEREEEEREEETGAPMVEVSAEEEEILDEEEGDPIDPSFHSPSRRTSTIGLPSISSPPPAPPADFSADPEEDTEQIRRQTIAERMAKLGGIKFGAAPIPASITRPPPPAPRERERESLDVPSEDHAEEVVDTRDEEEEEERARKARISAKLAGMGGMRIGMMPLGVGGLRPQQSHVMKEESVPEAEPEVDLSTSIAALPTRALPPSRPPPPPAPGPGSAQTQDSDVDLSNSQYSLSASEDGVKVEAEESELEEVSHEDAEEVPPPVPSRATRRGMSTSDSTYVPPPPVPATRPPVPTSVPSRKSSVLTTASVGRKSSVDSTSSVPPPPRRPSIPTTKQHSEYVMVEEPKGFEEDEEEIPPPPPPHRPTSRAPPARSAPPPPPPPPQNPEDSISSQWELPSIPTSSLEFGQDADLSLSWTEDPIPEEDTSPPPPPPHRETDRRASHAPPVTERHLSADDLMAVWGRVGVQICEAATLLFEKSKKSLVGDGTYAGFVDASLAEVPNAAQSSVVAGGEKSYGYLIYAQTGNAVQKRASEIMPGDVVELVDAKLKGHKGIHAYNQNVGGAGEPLLGVVSEFEPKKSKIRVFQANQHVGQQTVEAVSYRLDDLKSGTIKVFRVLEAE